ncbi:hypothetical protein EIP91_010528 [Steccherinum ochraceum]|uniref:Tet-like 2OG-Fe(II) oxygenase domain-containing protein n=1 Tax=Steccherinum ochraceum TaxID=92696 RepID=A0A4R0R0I2_9APHY|nr:hypothetical protein EIP91_010528 [Steccherinum ochraceum]
MASRLTTPDIVELLGLQLAPIDLSADSTDSAEAASRSRGHVEIEPYVPNVSALIPEDLPAGEGEVVGEKLTRNQSANKRRKARARKKREREDELRAEGATQLLGSLYRTSPNQIHTYRVRRQPELLSRLQELEAQNQAPLQMDDPDFPRDDLQWIIGSNEPTWHYVVDEVLDEVVLAVKITPWNSFPPVRRNKIQTNLGTAMDWSRCAHVIKTNSSQTKTQHGTGEAITIKRRGRMYAIGWHSSMEKNKDLVFYAGDRASVELYHETIQRLPVLADMYREHFFYLLPGAAQEMVDVAEELDIPSFSQLALDGDDAERPFANCLTLTNNDFANALHRDKDFSLLAFGMWWVTRVRREGHHDIYEFDPSLDHDSVKGGAFVLGEFGIGVDFQRAGGLVEIFWRGKQDWHVTMQSKAKPGCTRWGTSVQLTSKGVNAVKRYHKRGSKPSRTTSAFDRVETMQNAAAKKKKK